MYTFADYLRGELRPSYLLENDAPRYNERCKKFYMFLRVPIELEKFMFNAYFQIVVTFLSMFTLMPVRFLLSCWFLLTRPLSRLLSKFFLHQRHPRFAGDQPQSSAHRYLQPAETCDLLRGLILIVSIVLISYVDMSVLYHTIKSQAIFKLYIIFNLLELCDKLLSTFGIDVLDTLYWTATEPLPASLSRGRCCLGLLASAIVGVHLHVLLILAQATTLNVAINSKNSALLTIMMSNNFVELKGMVFKKFEKNNLFQMFCSDVRERHHLFVLLIIVLLQTLKEYNWDEEQFYRLLPDCLFILAAEVGIDWAKHAFVTRYNEITSEVYREYTVILAYDMVSSKMKGAHADHWDLVSRRMGFVPLALAALLIRVCASSLTVDWWRGHLCLALGFLCLLTFREAVNIALLGHSCELIERQRRAFRPRAAPRQCASLPSSRHASSDNVPQLLQGLALAQASKSTPQSPRTSLADITQQAQAMQENLEHSLLFSDSTVSLTSLKVRPPRSPLA